LGEKNGSQKKTFDGKSSGRIIWVNKREDLSKSDGGVRFWRGGDGGIKINGVRKKGGQSQRKFWVKPRRLASY